LRQKNTEGEWELKTNKDDIEQGCIAENIQRFSQANLTPLLQWQTIHLLRWRGEKQDSQNILSATNINNNLHPKFLRMAPFWSTSKAIADKGTLATKICIDEFEYMWKKSKEDTSCGRSGIHFGHFQASCSNSRLCDLDRWFVEVSLSTGYSLKRWKQGIDVRIPKKWIA
jgi:hypothetical protein